MPSASYSFLDIAVLDEVRQRFAAGDALAVLSSDLASVLWANGPGAKLFGAADIEQIIGAESRLTPVARRQVMATPGYPDIGRDKAVLVRLASRAVRFQASGLTLPGGEKAILLSVPADAARAPDPADAAQRVIGGISEPGHFAALVDAEGGVSAASDGFERLGIATETLSAMTAEMREANQRLLKRLIPALSGRLPAGMGRLTDTPATHLLIVIDAAQPEPAAVPIEADDAPPPEAVASGPREQDHHWYFDADRAATPVAAAPSTPQPEGERVTRPLRFTWRTDAEGRFSTISPELALAVGSRAADIVGRPFAEVAAEFGFDADGEIAGLLERRETWSGRTVLWPVPDSGLKVPVDLAALPIYRRDRRFEGFRGFGVARGGDAVAVPAPEPRDEAPAPPASTPETLPPDPFKGEVPVLSIVPKTERRFSDKIIRLAEHRGHAAEKALTAVERSAFREIGDRLKGDSQTADADIGVPASTPEAKDPEAEAVPAATAEMRDNRAEPPAMATTGAPEDTPGVPAGTPEPDTQPAEPPAAQPQAPVVQVDAAEGERPVFARDGFLPSAFPLGDRKAPLDTSLLARLPIAILVHSGDVLHFANDEFTALSGYPSVEELAAEGGLDRLFGEPYPAEEGDRKLRLIDQDGEEHAVDARLQSVPWNGGHALLLTLRPAERAPAETDRIAAAAAAASAAERAEIEARIDEMRAIVDTATDGVVLITRDGMIRSISRPAEALFGFDNDEVLGQPFVSLFAIESQRAARDYLAGLTEHGVASVLNDGREVIGREAQGRFIPLFMTIGRLPNDSGFCAVMRDITQWKRAEEELTQARAQAERASSQKTDFLARVSHEIRTPLNAIIGFSELMIDEKFGPVGNDRYRDYLRDINRSGNHVLDLVNDLLDISKIEAGEQEMAYEAVSLNDTLSETVAMMQPQANRERVIIRSSLARQAARSGGGPAQRAPDRAQPPFQRRALHAGGRPGHRLHRLRAERRRGDAGARHRRRHDAGRDRAGAEAIQAGQHAAPRPPGRHRPRPAADQGDGGGQPRQVRDRLHPGRGNAGGGGFPSTRVLAE